MRLFASPMADDSESGPIGNLRALGVWGCVLLQEYDSRPQTAEIVTDELRKLRAHRESAAGEAFYEDCHVRRKTVGRPFHEMSRCRTCTSPDILARDNVEGIPFLNSKIPHSERVFCSESELVVRVAVVASVAATAAAGAGAGIALAD